MQSGILVAHKDVGQSLKVDQKVALSLNFSVVYSLCPIPLEKRQSGKILLDRFLR